MSSEDYDISTEPTFWALIGSIITAIITGTGWCVQKRCRRTHFAIHSGCCECSADSDVLRQTIRAEIHAERQERESKSDTKEDDFILESPNILRIRSPHLKGSDNDVNQSMV